MTLRLALVVAAALCVVEARRVPKRSTLDRPTIGDALELRVPWKSDYLPGKQVVGVIPPNSDEPRRWDSSQKAFVGARDGKSLTWSVQKEFKPLKRVRQRRPAPPVREVQVHLAAEGHSKRGKHSECKYSQAVKHMQQA